MGHARAARGRASVFSDWLAERITPELRRRARGFRPADPDQRPAGPVDARHGADPDAAQARARAPRSRACSRASRQSWREDRKPANMMLVVDVSGSMSEENKLEQAKRRACALPPPARPAGPRRPDLLQRPRHAAPAGRAVRTNRARLRAAVDTTCSPTARPRSTTPRSTAFKSAQDLNDDDAHQRRRRAHRRRGQPVQRDAPRAWCASSRPVAQRGPGRPRLHDRLREQAEQGRLAARDGVAAARLRGRPARTSRPSTARSLLLLAMRQQQVRPATCGARSCSTRRPSRSTSLVPAGGARGRACSSAVVAAAVAVRRLRSRSRS